MPNCNVFTCKNRSETSSLKKEKITFHLFPKELSLCAAWIRACDNHATWIPKRTSTICSQHFEASCFVLQSNNKRRLKQGSLPTLNLSKVEPCDGCGGEIKKEVDSEDESQKCEISKLQPHSSENITALNSTYNTQLENTPRVKMLRTRLQMKNKQIKRIQSQKLYLKKKIAKLQEILKSLIEKSLINEEERSALDEIGVEAKELLNRQLLKIKMGNISKTKLERMTSPVDFNG